MSIRHKLAQEISNRRFSIRIRFHYNLRFFRNSVSLRYGPMMARLSPLFLKIARATARTSSAFICFYSIDYLLRWQKRLREDLLPAVEACEFVRRLKAQGSGCRSCGPLNVGAPSRGPVRRAISRHSSRIALMTISIFRVVHARGNAEDAVIKQKIRVGAHVIGRAELFAHALEKPRAHAAAQEHPRAPGSHTAAYQKDQTRGNRAQDAPGRIL